ncbi:hypothetical protein V8C37DRAFT_407635 [Trichoderma ceciliae]
MDNSGILSWVCSLPEEAVKHDTSLYLDATHNLKIAPRKRKIATSSRLASPPSSSMSADYNNMASTPKRPRVESVDAPVDLETTPQRAAPSFTGPSASPDLPRSLERETFRTGSASKISSSKEQIMSLSLNDTFVYAELVLRTVPVAAKKLYQSMQKFSESKNTLPHGFQQAITQQQVITQQRMTTLQQAITQQQAVAQMENYQSKIEEYEELKDSCRPESAPNDNLPGRIPSLDEIDEVVRKAFQVSSHRDNESRWNGAVNLRLLDMIFEDPLVGLYSKFGATDCTTAQLHREFRPLASLAKMINGCVYASFEDDEEWTSAMKKFALANPTLTVNYTNFEPLQLKPLILSIETKKPAAELEKAKLQIGIWHATHWNFLEWAVGKKLLQQRLNQGLGEPTTAQDEKELETKKLTALSTLSFLPGIIINTAFGTTRTIKGAYAIVAGVRELTAWGRDVYLPWFKEHVLMFN